MFCLLVLSICLFAHLFVTFVSFVSSFVHSEGGVCEDCRHGDINAPASSLGSAQLPSTWRPYYLTVFGAHVLPASLSGEITRVEQRCGENKEDLLLGFVVLWWDRGEAWCRLLGTVPGCALRLWHRGVSCRTPLGPKAGSALSLQLGRESRPAAEGPAVTPSLWE